MKGYHDLLRMILAKGEVSEDRTGTGTISVFGAQIRFDLSQGFPLLTTKRLSFHSIAHELIWFLRGDTNVRYLQDNHVSIWDDWADEHGDLGPVYGAQWKYWLDARQAVASITDEVLDAGSSYAPVSFGTLDQIAQVVGQIKACPSSRRHIVTAWNPSDVPYMALPPCHCLFQFYVRNGRLSCHMYQRSADAFLGVPYNVASYALLTELIARETGLEAGDLIISFGDLHIYRNHVEQVAEQLSREPRELPQLRIAPEFDFNNPALPKGSGWLSVLNYNPHPAIKAEIAV